VIGDPGQVRPRRFPDAALGGIERSHRQNRSRVRDRESLKRLRVRMAYVHSGSNGACLSDGGVFESTVVCTVDGGAPNVSSP
jgi:hypothetical protein